MKSSFYDRREQALLAAVFTQDQPRHYTEYQVEELKHLARTAGAKVAHVCTQHLKSIHPATYIGMGKVQELKGIISQGQYDIVLFSRGLSPVQQRNLERALHRRIVDRSELILDIFAQHAHTRDGKIQVELAQLRYLRPRLTGRGSDFSRLGGGIGTRGPGETQLEIDRRRIDQRIAHLHREWEAIRSTHRLQRKSRSRQSIPGGALVGYTNAGKSTLLNRLTSARVIARDQLFSTLDTTTRRLYLPGDRLIVLSDTVGFITDLPETLLAAFRATLEEVEESDFLIHVVDASSPYLMEQFYAVHDVLHELGSERKPTLTLFNKMDAVRDEFDLKELEHQVSPSLRCSARHDPDLFPLMHAISDLIRSHEHEMKPPPPAEGADDEPFDPFSR